MSFVDPMLSPVYAEGAPSSPSTPEDPWKALEAQHRKKPVPLPVHAEWPKLLDDGQAFPPGARKN